MNRVAYGKTMKELKWTPKPNFMYNYITLELSKLAYAAICTLNLSKVLMYKFHYDYIKHKYGNNSKLLFTNTGIMIFKIKPKLFMKILVRIMKC